MKLIEEGNYDITLHFSRKLEIPLVELSQSKAKSFAVVKSNEKSLRIIITFHSNTAIEYRIDLKAGVTDPFFQKAEFG